MQIFRIPSSLEPLNQGVWIESLVIFPNVQSSKELVYYKLDISGENTINVGQGCTGKKGTGCSMVVHSCCHTILQLRICFYIINPNLAISPYGNCLVDLPRKTLLIIVCADIVVVCTEKSLFLQQGFPQPTSTCIWTCPANRDFISHSWGIPYSSRFG